MADEIRTSFGLVAEKGNNKFSRFVQNTLSDWTNARGANPGTVSIGTSEEDVSFGDLATPGWMVMTNLDATNYVDWGPNSGGSMVLCGRLYPGQSAQFFLHPSVTLRMKANTAACDVRIEALDT